jgi:hypothetical protein
MVIDPKELKKIIDGKKASVMQSVEASLDEILEVQVLNDGFFDVTIKPEVMIGKDYSKLTGSMERSLLDRYIALGWNAFYELAKDGKPYVWRFIYDPDK